VRRILLPVLIAALLSPAGVARADPVQDVSLQIKDVKPDGRYTVVFAANSYDTTGGPAPLVASNMLRFPAGAKIRPEFLTRRYQCRVADIRDALLVPDGRLTYTSRLRNLRASLARTRARLSPRLAAGVEACARSQVGYGDVVVDFRPVFQEPVPFNFFMYLSKPAVKGAIASFGILVVLSENAWLYRESPTFRSFRLLLAVNFFDEPSPDGRYGYRLQLPDPSDSGYRVTLAELRATTYGLTQLKKTVACVARQGGTCTKRKVSTKRLFWLTQPTCPATGLLGFESSYVYETGQTATKTVELPCPRFRL
jgi:hypothetical protein